jgi:uncharacterized protein
LIDSEGLAMGKYHLTHKVEREITDAGEIRRIMHDGKYAAIAMCRDNEPYVVTMSYGYDEPKNALYFHCANHGLKMDFLAINKNVCATVVEDRGYATGECSHLYNSAVFWGKMSIVESLDEKIHGLSVMIDQLEESPGRRKEEVAQYKDEFDGFTILRLDIQDITAKHGK